jgi:hypothetical protein
MVLASSGRSSAAFVLSLIGGLLIFVSSAISIMWFTVGSTPFGVYAGMMSHFGFDSGYLFGFSVLGLVCGVLIVVGAFMFNLRPLDHVTWGAVVPTFSIVSFVSMGGWFVGAASGIAGGVLGMVWRSR